jgi:hypothetical protein
MVVNGWIYNPDLIWQIIFLRSNHGPWFTNGRSSGILLRLLAPVKQRPGAAPWPMARRSQIRSIFHQTLNGFFLRDICYERNQFFLLTVTETDEWRTVMVSWLDRGMLIVRATSNGSPVTLKTPTWAVNLGEALGILQWVRGDMTQCGDEERRKLGFWAWLHEM